MDTHVTQHSEAGAGRGTYGQARLPSKTCLKIHFKKIINKPGHGGADL